MEISYANEEELEEEGDAIAYKNDERLDLGGESDSSIEDQVMIGQTATGPGKLKKGGLAKYSSEAKKFDMSDVDNHYRFLQHIDQIPKPEESQVKLNLEGIDIYFPMKPYQVQMDYMKKVIQSCNLGKHALLESPTGTGKTLCLLTATLAWLTHWRQNVATEELNISKIIYCSRTHSQISQVANELKHTAYKPKMCLIGSRDQLCVNP